MLANPTRESYLKFARLCGAAPLVTGILITVAFVVTESELFFLAGLFCILCGLAAFVAGVGALVLARRTPIHEDDVPSRRWWRSGWFAVLLLIANFPCAATCMYVADAVITRYTVEIENDTPDVIREARIVGGGVDITMDAIPAGEARKTHLRIEEDDSLRLELTVGSKRNTVVIDGYVTPSLGGKKHVVIQKDGAVEIH